MASRRTSSRVGAAILALASGVAWVGCGTGNGDATGDGTADPGATSTAASATGTTRPAFEAGFPDAGPEASVDPTPDGGDVCIDNADPGSSENTARALTNIDDCDSSGSSVNGVVNGAVDVDFYEFQGTDTIGCKVDPTIWSSTTGLEICMFVSCLSGSTNFKGCTGGASATSGIGNPGCCVATPGSTTLSYSCGGITQTNDSATVFMRVKQVGNACLPYTFSYHF